MNGPSRRAVLASLVTAGCAARIHPISLIPAPSPRLPERLMLGWRWVPGAIGSWRTQLTLADQPSVAIRTQAWRYLATDLDLEGIVSIEGQLIGLGIEAADPSETHPPIDSVAPDTVALRMRLNGRMLSCSATSFVDALPHRLLALHFPVTPTAPGDAWTDGALLRLLEPLVPAGLTPTTRATTTFAAFEGDGNAPVVTLQHDASLAFDSYGPTLRLTGQSRWDPVQGVLLERDLTAAMDDAATHAALRIKMWREHMG